jgi:hypothetical protein
MFKYYLCTQLDGQQKNVLSVTFCTGRYGGLTQTIKFSTPVTEQQAVSKVEHWLNQPMSDEHFTALKENEDLFCGGHGLKFGDLQYNWEALGDCHFLEVIERNGQEITIVCGS